MRFPFPPATEDSIPADAFEVPEAVEQMEAPSTPSLPGAGEEPSEGGIVGDIERIVANLEQREAGSLFDSDTSQAAAVADDSASVGRAAPAAPRPRSRRKVIAFPRPTSPPPPTFHRLADPVVPEQPRILDVPEELEAFPATPLLDGLHLPATAEATVTPPDHIELPFQAVEISRRVYAGLIDGSLVAAAMAVFCAVAYKMLPSVGHGKPLLTAAGGTLVLLWTIYQYMFLMYGAATPGMRSVGVGIRTFKGGPPSWRHRRSRVIGLYLSTASLMMGLLWALVDVDALCWHDRISRTYLTNED